MEIKEIKKLKKNLPRFICEVCDFECYMKCDWDRHVLRPKHIKWANGNQMETKKLKKTYFCDCGKNFLSNSGLWKHKKSCNKDAYTEQPDKELIMMLVKQNSELMGVIKNGTHNNSHNTNNNSHNKTFNLNFFLNETCKDAMNITDFVSSVKLSLEDLEHTGRQGYIDGISNIILKNLNNLEHYKRPIHCSDSKREVLYIKDNDKWEKEGESKPILTKAIKIIANENIKQIKDWKNKYPDCTNSDSNKNNLYLKIVSNSMNGSTQEESNKNITKIINNVAKDTIIQKD
jgi:hypothetical protein